MTSTTVTIPGVPVPCARPRHTILWYVILKALDNGILVGCVTKKQKRDRLARLHASTTYTQTRDKEYQEKVRTAFLKTGHAPAEPYTGPLRMTATFTFPVTPSWSKTKQRQALSGELACTNCRLGDLDNLEKNIMDALNKLLYKDDAQIVQKSSAKVYGLDPGTTVTFEAIGAVKKKEGRDGEV